MSSAIQYCIKHKLINPPPFTNTNLVYETTFGSRAYGVADESSSDYDITGIVVPPKSYIFPNLDGYIPGFDTDYPKFESYQDHHVNDKSSGKQFDITVYNIVHYFRLLYDNNPNILDSLFVPEHCIRHITKIGHLLRDNRKQFLSKQCWIKYRCYAASQFHKLETKSPEGKRKETVSKYGYDVKFAYNVFRLLDSSEQILFDQDLNLTKNNGEWKAIRNGQWSLERVKEEFSRRKVEVEEKVANSTLRDKVDKKFARDLLFECLETQYGSLSDIVSRPESFKDALKQIDLILDKKRLELYQ